MDERRWKICSKRDSDYDDIDHGDNKVDNVQWEQDENKESQEDGP